MILALNDDVILSLEDGRLTMLPEVERYRRLFDGRKLRTRRAVETEGVPGEGEEVVEAETPGEKMRDLVRIARAAVLVDDGDT